MEKQRILCVDDNPDNLFTLQTVLNDINADIVLAESGEEALNLISSGDFALAILDVQMPVMDGYELAGKIKNLGKDKSFPIIFLSAVYSDYKHKLQGYEADAVDYITKPFEPFFLETKVKKLLQLDKMRGELAEKADAEEKLKNYFESILHSTKEAIVVINFDSSVIKANNAAITLWQYSSKEINGTDASGLVEGEPFQNWLQNLSLYHKDKNISELYLNDVEVIIHTKKGHRNPAIINGSPLLDSKNNVQGGVFTVTELSVRKFLEKAFWENEEKLRYIAAFANDAILMIDPKGKICFWNNAATKIFGYNDTEVFGKDMHSLIAPQKYHESFMSGFPRFLNTGEGNLLNKTQEVTAIRKSGEEFPVELSLSAIMIKNKWNAIGIIRDISERKKTETELIAAKEKAEECDKLKTAFLHNISHEIRTPMNAIVGFSSLLLLEPGLSPENKSFIETIVQSSDQLLSIISDIVEISNIEAGIVKISKSEVDLNATLKSLYDIFILKAKEKNKSLIIKLTLPESPVKIISDTTRIYQILSNLLSNALKFTESGQIELGYSRKNDNIEFFVSDTGIGLSKEDRVRIFERFYLVDYSEARQYEGAGLGLSISKGFVELLGGKIWLTSEPGKGSVFYFNLPSGNLSSHEQIFKKKVPEQIKEPLKRRKILVAEDVESNFNLFSYYLSSVNADIIRASNGKEAIELFNRNPDIDLILMDIKMPVMDGYAATKQIRATNPDIPIIAQTAFADECTKAMESGCNGFISKPFDKNQLLSVINEYL